MTTDKSNLLNQLRIDRADVPQAEGVAFWWWIVGGGAAFLILLGAWFFLSGSSGSPVRAATAKAAVAAGTGNSAGAASMLDASGYVVARRQATVSFKVTGKVLEVPIEEGQYVEKDQVMARLDDSNARATMDFAKAQVQQAEAALNAAKLAFENAKPIFERNTELLKRGVISQTAFDNSKSSFDAVESSLRVSTKSLEVSRANLAMAQRNADDTIVRAPFPGVVTVKAAQPGEMVSPISAGGGFTRTGVGTIVDMDSLEVEVDVSENFISRVHANQPATIKLNAYPDWSIAGEIIAVIPTADRAKATVKVRVGFKERDARILPQMGARVAFLSAAAPNATGSVAAAPGVIVPIDAVQGTGETGVVFVIRGDKVERRAVKLGGRSADGQTILSGVSAGDRVAVGDTTKLTDGAEVHIE